LGRYLTAPGTTGRFLDVGTGSGERLLELAAAGWEVVGQDVDPEAGGVARAHGIEVHTCSVPDLVGVEEPFDLIGLNHVLEHVPDPAEVLRACGALLTPAGRICVIAPNAQALGRLVFGRWWFGLEQPRHLAIPTKQSLERLASRLPLRVVEAGTTAANAAVLLGGSLARPIEARVPAGRWQRGVGSAVHVVGQVLGRAAVTLDGRRGEEVTWVAQRTVT
jgi:SAM-dependent methyltransferase